MNKPLCFVLMPFGSKPDGTGRIIDFNQVYAQIIEPAVEAAEMTPLRADQETSGGIIHKPMFERLMLCDYAVADLTGANANVFYELGIRHVVRPYTTVSLFAGDTRLPFDVNFLRAHPYSVDKQGGLLDVAGARAALEKKLRLAREEAKEQLLPDSPIYQLLPWWKSPDVAHTKDDLLRATFEHSDREKRLAAARRTVAPSQKDRELHVGDALRDMKAIEQELGPLVDASASVVFDLLYSYRALGTAEGWQAMVNLVDEMAALLRRTALVQEQYAFALNRLKRHDAAQTVLEEVLKIHGPSSETLALLGRVYKDLWEAAQKSGDAALADGYLDLAINTYLKGFEVDWRDTYPGINAATLMEVAGDERVGPLLPVVRYAAERRVTRATPDYWDHATVLEAAVLARDEQGARKALRGALPLRKEAWMGETTARNLRLIREAREARGDAAPWASELERTLSPPK